MKENPLFYTATMARVCAAQGHLEKSADIYRCLLKADPDNQKTRERLADLEQQLFLLDPAPAEEGRPPDSLAKLISQWVGLLVERDLKCRFDDLRKKIKTMNRTAE